MNYIIGLLGVIVLGLLITCGNLLQTNAELKQILEINEAVVDSQNKAIEQIIIDSEKYACSLEAMEDFARSKYAKVESEHIGESCESKLEALESLLDIYHND